MVLACTTRTSSPAKPKLPRHRLPVTIQFINCFFHFFIEFFIEKSYHTSRIFSPRKHLKISGIKNFPAISSIVTSETSPTASPVCVCAPLLLFKKTAISSGSTVWCYHRTARYSGFPLPAHSQTARYLSVLQTRPVPSFLSPVPNR